MSIPPAASDGFALDAVLDDPAQRVIVCCGSGGVGKTTMSAAIALRAAERGRRVVVLTIDPARRLAQSLGIAELGNEPHTVPGTDGDGTLEAMALDMKRTFDEIVEAHADPERAAAILENPFYQSLSSSFAGTQEYMAMEKLAQLSRRTAEDGTWDLIVVDTPPSRSALDFLDAPERLGSFLDGPFIRLLMAPARKGGRAGLKFLGAGVGVVSGVLDRILGAQLLGDVQTFVAALDTMFGSFRERAEETYRLLQEPGTTFLVVAAPEPDALREAAYFVDRLQQDGLPLAACLVNRMSVPYAEELSADAAAGAAERDDADALTASLLRLHARAARTHRRQQRLVDSFARAHAATPVVEVAALAQDVHDVLGLREVGDLLAAAPVRTPAGSPDPGR